MSAPTGIEKYALLMLLVADRERATHVKIVGAGTAAVIQLWRGDGWAESDLTDRSYPFHLPLMRQLSTMLSGTMPGQGQTLTGRFALEREGTDPLYILGAIDHDHEVAAYLELVDAATYATGRSPQSPAGAVS
jgi:hypothetical protein